MSWHGLLVCGWVAQLASNRARRTGGFNMPLVEPGSRHTNELRVQLSQRRSLAMKVALPTHALLAGGFLKGSPVNTPDALLSGKTDL